MYWQIKNNEMNGVSLLIYGLEKGTKKLKDDLWIWFYTF